MQNLVPRLEVVRLLRRLQHILSILPGRLAGRDGDAGRVAVRLRVVVVDVVPAASERDLVGAGIRGDRDFDLFMFFRIRTRHGERLIILRAALCNPYI